MERVFSPYIIFLSFCVARCHKVSYNVTEWFKARKAEKVFLGEYKHTMDSKGRVVIPSKFRKELQQGCVVTKGLDNCLQILTKKNWNQESEKMASLPSTDKTSRQLRRALFSGAVDSSLDSAGRIQIPENLRAYSAISENDDVTVTGSGPVIEIWATKTWKKIQSDSDNAFANINEVKG